uniref:Complex 1 LYR protein domain-containing protein n=1 Tax=Arcella intermedia TaxID=1963864 RepID=A0A6B2LWY9_9EUKA
MYRQLLRGGRNFKSYEYREYVQRRVKEDFRKYKDITDVPEREKLIAKAVEMKGVVRRQSQINSMYAQDDLILHVKKSPST